MLFCMYFDVNWNELIGFAIIHIYEIASVCAGCGFRSIFSTALSTKTDHSLICIITSLYMSCIALMCCGHKTEHLLFYFCHKSLRRTIIKKDPFSFLASQIFINLTSAALLNTHLPYYFA